MGYTPLFDTTLTGTLYGRWPHTGIWACLLSRTSRDGLIDETPPALAAAIGVPVETLMACITDFMNPDPDSRSMEHEGRRLAPIHEGRSWGWRVINHGKYREKARKKSFDESRTTSGDDAERKRNERASREVPTRPAKSREVPLSDAEATPPKKPLTLHPSLPAAEWSEWIEHRKTKRWSNDNTTLRKQLNVLVAYDTETQRRMIDTAINAGWQGIFPPKNSDLPKSTQPVMR